MKRFSGIALFACVVAVGAYAVDDNQPQPNATVQKDSVAIPKRDNGAIPPRWGAAENKQRAVSRESAEYLHQLRRRSHLMANLVVSVSILYNGSRRSLAYPYLVRQAIGWTGLNRNERCRRCVDGKQGSKEEISDQ